MEHSLLFSTTLISLIVVTTRSMYSQVYYNRPTELENFKYVDFLKTYNILSTLPRFYQNNTNNCRNNVQNDRHYFEVYINDNDDVYAYIYIPLHDYHYNCLRAMRDTNERNRMNMRCAQCRRPIFGILDLERQNRYLLYEDEEICPICQDRLGREFEPGRMRCTCTARFYYRCLHQ
jgi:hypothetical protein